MSGGDLVFISIPQDSISLCGLCSLKHKTLCVPLRALRFKKYLSFIDVQDGRKEMTTERQQNLCELCEKLCVPCVMLLSCDAFSIVWIVASCHKTLDIIGLLSYNPPMRTWTPEQRQKQRDAIKRWTPWKKSTGPRTSQGKSISRFNAYKHGLRSVGGRQLIANLFRQRCYINHINALLKQHTNTPNELLRSSSSSSPDAHLRSPKIMLFLPQPIS
jgi:hypothetical protein